jgi:hypothetical protein
LNGLGLGIENVIFDVGHHERADALKIDKHHEACDTWFQNKAIGDEHSCAGVKDRASGENDGIAGFVRKRLFLCHRHGELKRPMDVEIGVSKCCGHT